VVPASEAVRVSVAGRAGASGATSVLRRGRSGVTMASLQSRQAGGKIPPLASKAVERGVRLAILISEAEMLSEVGLAGRKGDLCKRGYLWVQFLVAARRAV
jgi:hypothetical protein